MSYEAEQESHDGAEVENADDLTMALAGGETTFVSETKQPLSKGTMVVAGLLIACGAVTYFMYVRTGPAQALASPESQQAEQIVKGFISGPDKAREWADLIKATEKVVHEFRKEPKQVPLAALAGNPFQIGTPEPDEDKDAAKRKTQLEKFKASAKEAVGELKLQTIIHRDPKKAAVMINNRMYRKGEKIPVPDSNVTFTVAEIRPDAVTITAPAPVAGEEPVKFELSMKR